MAFYIHKQRGRTLRFQLPAQPMKVWQSSSSFEELTTRRAVTLQMLEVSDPVADFVSWVLGTSLGPAGSALFQAESTDALPLVS